MEANHNQKKQTKSNQNKNDFISNQIMNLIRSHDTIWINKSRHKYWYLLDIDIDIIVDIDIIDNL